jgi:hypothetical protein
LRLSARLTVKGDQAQLGGDGLHEQLNRMNVNSTGEAGFGCSQTHFVASWTTKRSESRSSSAANSLNVSGTRERFFENHRWKPSRLVAFLEYVIHAIALGLMPNFRRFSRACY